MAVSELIQEWLPPAGPPLAGLDDDRPIPAQPAHAHELRGGSADGVLITRAIRAEELLQAYRFAHDADVDHGMIETARRGPRLTRFQAVPETAAFVAKAGQEVIAVQAAVADSEDMGLPSDGPFFVEINALRRQGRAICEAARPAISIPFQRSIVPGELIRCCVAYAAELGCNGLIAPAAPWQARQYREMGFRRTGPVRVFSREMPFPAILMAMNLDELARPAGRLGEARLPAIWLRDRYLKDNPYRRHVGQWSDLAERAFDDPAFLWKLFVLGTDLLSRCTCGELAAIRRRWGAGLFDSVWHGGAAPAWAAWPRDPVDVIN